MDDERVLRVRQRADAWREIDVPKSTAGDRKVPLPQPVWNALREWKLSCPSGDLDLVFPTRDGTIQFHGNIVNRCWYPLQISIGLTYLDGAKYNFHGLRHFYASWCIAQGYTQQKLQTLMGHSSIVMTMDIYGHLFPDTKDDHAKLDAAAAKLVSA
jgi:integrase